MKAFLGALVILLMLGGYSYVVFLWGALTQERRMVSEGWSDLRAKRLLREAARIMGMLGVSPSLNDLEIIRPSTRAAVDEWLASYDRKGATGGKPSDHDL